MDNEGIVVYMRNGWDLYNPDTIHCNEDTP
jgi:hypothetical protein